MRSNGRPHEKEQSRVRGPPNRVVSSLGRSKGPCKHSRHKSYITSGGVTSHPTGGNHHQPSTSVPSCTFVARPTQSFI